MIVRDKIENARRGEIKGRKRRRWNKIDRGKKRGNNFQAMVSVNIGNFEIFYFIQALNNKNIK